MWQISELESQSNGLASLTFHHLLCEIVLLDCAVMPPACACLCICSAQHEPEASLWIFFMVAAAVLVCVFVSAWHYQYLLHHQVGWQQVVQGKEKGQWMTLTGTVLRERLPVPGTLSWSLIADVCLIAQGLGALDTSLSPLSLPARKQSPPPEHPITASNYRPYLCQSLCLSLSSVARYAEHRVAGSPWMARWSRRRTMKLDKVGRGKRWRELTEGVCMSHVLKCESPVRIHRQFKTACKQSKKGKKGGKVVKLLNSRERDFLGCVLIDRLWFSPAAALGQVVLLVNFYWLRGELYQPYLADVPTLYWRFLLITPLYTITLVGNR